jgi:hypothetical protein
MSDSVDVKFGRGNVLLVGLLGGLSTGTLDGLRNVVGGLPDESQ